MMPAAPLKVDFIKLPGFTGRLGLAFTPGRAERDQQSGMVSKRDLRRDIAALKSVKTGVIVTLLDAFEIPVVTAPDLFDRIREVGIRSMWIPIVEGHVPQSMQFTVGIVKHIVDELYAGKTVVLHCKQCGIRTGMIAACCCVAMGVPAQAAIAMVNSVRASAVINRPNAEQFVYRFAQAWETREVHDKRGHEEPLL